MHVETDQSELVELHNTAYCCSFSFTLYHTITVSAISAARGCTIPLMNRAFILSFISYGHADSINSVKYIKYVSVLSLTLVKWLHLDI